MPVGGRVIVETEMKNGDRNELPAIQFYWGRSSNIVKYRIIKEDK